MLKISIGSDHGGFKKKELLKQFLINNGFEVIDVGTFSEDSCDYPVYAKEAAIKVSSGETNYGIVICTTGEGICIAANKVKGVRCGIGYNDDVAVMMRKHNNANMIAYGAKYTSIEEMENRSLLFINTEFEGGRHQRRVDEIMEIEK